LAKELGKTLYEIKQMPSSELTSWMAFYDIEPFDDIKEDIRLALLRFTILNASSKEFRNKIEIKDLLPFWNKEKKEKDRDENLNILHQMKNNYKNKKG